MAFANNQLVAEGITRVTLPVKKEDEEIIAGKLDNLKLFGEQTLRILDADAVVEVPSGDQQPSVEENS